MPHLKHTKQPHERIQRERGKKGCSLFLCFFFQGVSKHAFHIFFFFLAFFPSSCIPSNEHDEVLDSRGFDFLLLLFFSFSVVKDVLFACMGGQCEHWLKEREERERGNWLVLPEKGALHPSCCLLGKSSSCFLSSFVCYSKKRKSVVGKGGGRKKKVKKGLRYVSTLLSLLLLLLLLSFFFSFTSLYCISREHFNFVFVVLLGVFFSPCRFDVHNFYFSEIEKKKRNGSTLLRKVCPQQERERKKKKEKGWCSSK